MLGLNDGAGLWGARFPPAQGTTKGGGVNPGPIWPCLASFTPTAEAGNEATVASFGPPLTRMQWACRPWLWPCLASLRVARSGETFNSVPFGSISFHSYRLRGAGMRGSRLHGNDVYEQCSNQRGYGVRGSCRWFGVGGSPSSSLLAEGEGTCRGRGCEVRAFAETTEPASCG